MSDPSQWQTSSPSDQQHYVDMNQHYLYNRSFPLQLRPLQPNPNPTREHNFYPFSVGSTTETEKNKEGKRIRVSRACDVCRRRKIKCENIAPGEACKNCKASNNECTFKDSAKKRGPPKG
ncbi:uncharacterized protein B0P05DRAFT_209176 [Gilbertella persicaria]|uniref:uncharacterized protein n=1 Tax=Gilbertella persicaria TaxID=101096 RepID=UPI00221E3B88|nr:uncharacterized protein B0P05DRAFT_209176 [Gilbertella persicaria]KAI8066209.1 hypothetical protein B0P05DRAFT_209176 [Gilbertella persicaria]